MFLSKTNIPKNLESRRHCVEICSEKLTYIGEILRSSPERRRITPREVVNFYEEGECVGQCTSLEQSSFFDHGSFVANTRRVTVSLPDTASKGISYSPPLYLSER